LEGVDLLMPPPGGAAMPRRSCKTFWNEPGSPTFRPLISRSSTLPWGKGTQPSHGWPRLVGTLDLARVQQMGTSAGSSEKRSALPGTTAPYRPSSV